MSLACGKVDTGEMRKLLSLLAALGLASLGSLPVSACAAVHSRVSECATPQTKAGCGHMGMEHAKEPPVSALRSSKTCCSISLPPRPEAQPWAGSFAVFAPPAMASGLIAVKPLLENAWSPDRAQDPSPPPLQSLLCTFLI